MTKKSAKHTAAENLLKKLQRNQNGDGDDMSDEDESATLDSDYISDLLDYCTVKDFHKPDFDCILSCGPSHAPSFTFRCSLDSIKKEATAETKKMAKQLSAKAILEEVKKVWVWVVGAPITKVDVFSIFLVLSRLREEARIVQQS